MTMIRVRQLTHGYRSGSVNHWINPAFVVGLVDVDPVENSIPRLYFVEMSLPVADPTGYPERRHPSIIGLTTVMEVDRESYVAVLRAMGVNVNGD